MDYVKTIRNFAIIAFLALVIAEAPGGGNLANGILAAMNVLFVGLIGFALYVGYRNNRLSFLALDENQRRMFVASLGAIALMVAGLDELFRTGLGALLWFGVVGFAAFTMVRVVIDSRSY
ncbi:hypothetical protein BH10ACT11_BH10ACT11_15840 [soil metagenome]